MRVAEDGLRHGEAAARARVASLPAADRSGPPWLRPWTWLLRAWVLDLDGRRPEAIRLYKQVLNRPHGDAALAAEAGARLTTPFTPARATSSAEDGRYH